MLPQFVFCTTRFKERTNMYYRRKVLLALLSQCGGKIEKLKLQKLLLLFCSKQQNPAYDFVPYKFGCFSFGANADLVAMKRKGLIEETETSWIILKETPESKQLDSTDLVNLELICDKYAKLSTEELIFQTYLLLPYYAINSSIAIKLLNDEQMQKVKKTIIDDNSTTLFTIGYEGKSLEQFLNTLIRNNIRFLCDVRKNAMSMKYGFAKGTLSNACHNVGIRYFHIPSLGIESAERKDLATKEDYRKLFEEYRAGVLLNTTAEQNQILQYLSIEKRVALMCFEKDPQMCHRSHLAATLVALSKLNLPLIHL